MRPQLTEALTGRRKLYGRINPEACAADFERNLQAITRGKISLFLSILFQKLIHAAGGINQLMLSGEKRMALGADLDPDARLSRTGVDRLAAGANNRGFFVVWVDFLFHYFLLNLPAITGR